MVDTQTLLQWASRFRVAAASLEEAAVALRDIPPSQVPGASDELKRSIQTILDDRPEASFSPSMIVSELAGRGKPLTVKRPDIAVFRRLKRLVLSGEVNQTQVQSGRCPSKYQTAKKGA